MSEINSLEPRIVWGFFDQITQIPRPSKKEGEMIEFLERFAREHGLRHKKDRAGNVVITCTAAPSMKDKPAVVLQSHMDMVCEKNAEHTFDFDKDAIEAYIDGGWVKARGTTLGADDGIGMAAALAALTTTEVELPEIEALFTVDEETGLTGAFNLERDMLTGKFLINLDSEEEGEIFIGCAGGVDTVATFSFEPCKAEGDLAFFRLDISGLKGGHSGDDIDKGRANSNKLMARFLWNAMRGIELRVAKLNGGNLRNAIPREAYALFGVPKPHIRPLFEMFEGFRDDALREFGAAEPSMDITISEAPCQESLLDKKSQRALIDVLQGVPNGVLAMSAEMPGLVETSTNLASVKQSDGNKIVVTTSQRSSIDSARFNAAASVRSVFELGGGTVVNSDGYPGWKPDPESHILKVAKGCYLKLFDKKPKVRAIHAGLECGLFLQKYPELQMISIGPTLRGVHSPDECLEIASVEKFWRFLLAILQSI